MLAVEKILKVILHDCNTHDCLERVLNDSCLMADSLSQEEKFVRFDDQMGLVRKDNR